MVGIDNFFGANALLSGAQGNGSTVFVGTANKRNILIVQTLVSSKNIGGQISTGQMPNVQRAIGVRQGRRNGYGFRHATKVAVYGVIWWTEQGKEKALFFIFL